MLVCPGKEGLPLRKARAEAFHKTCAATKGSNENGFLTRTSELRHCRLSSLRRVTHLYAALNYSLVLPEPRVQRPYSFSAAWGGGISVVLCIEALHFAIAILND